MDDMTMDERLAALLAMIATLLPEGSPQRDRALAACELQCAAAGVSFAETMEGATMGVAWADAFGART